MAQHPSGLGGAKRQHLLERGSVRTFASTQAGGTIAQRQQSATHYPRVTSLVDERIDAPLLEAVVLVNVAVARHHRLALSPSESPAFAGNLHMWGVVVLAFVKTRLPIVQIGRRIGDLAQLPERHEGTVAARLNAADHLAFHRLATRHRYRRIDATHIPLPADAGDCESMPKQKAIARSTGVFQKRRRVRSVEHPKHQRPAAIGYVDEQLLRRH